MPRQNRYHPYASRPRQSSMSPPIPQHPVPRHQRLPALTIPHQPSLSTIRENDTAPIHSYHAPASTYQAPPPPKPFQTIYPAYIRGTTTDGKALYTKSILQSPNGTFHIQMQALRYPSEFIGYVCAPTPGRPEAASSGINEIYEQWVSNGPGPTFLDAEAGCGTAELQRSTTPLSQDSGMGSSSGSDDGKSVSEEDAMDDEDGLYDELLICYEGQLC